MSGVRLIGLMLLALAAAAILASLGYPAGRAGVPGPALFPRLVGAALAACALWLIWRPGIATPLDIPPGRPRAIAMTAVLLVAYAATWDVVPFVPRTALLLVAFLRLLSVGWTGTLVTAVGLSVVTFVVFERLLAVRL
jgi:putative tricarboxylic transport membrane protein